MNKSMIFLGFSFFLTACEHSDSPTDSVPVKQVSSTYSMVSAIPLDSANKMINSYLSSVNADTDSTKIQSLIFEAEPLRFKY